jgi:hypothetical protein
MRCPRISVTLSALVVVVGSFTASPTRARANDIPLAFGANAAMFTMNAASLNAAHWAAAMSSHTFLSSIEPREEHEGLGGSICCSANHVWKMHDKGWEHHDDDGNDDGRTASVPEPATGFLVFSGITALAGWRLRRRSARNTPANLA